MTPSKTIKNLRITQIRSRIGHSRQAKRTLDALGIKKLNHAVILKDTPVTRGMIRVVNYLVKVEKVS